MTPHTVHLYWAAVYGRAMAFYCTRLGDLWAAPVYALSERGTPPVCVFSGVWCLAV